MKRRILPDFENETIQAYNFDVIIVGTGVAGLYAALNLPEDINALLVSKKELPYHTQHPNRRNVL